MWKSVVKRLTLLSIVALVVLPTVLVTAQDDCASVLFQAYGLLRDAQSAIEDDDIEEALELVQEAEALLQGCSGGENSDPQDTVVPQDTASPRATSTPAATATPQSQPTRTRIFSFGATATPGDDNNDPEPTQRSSSPDDGVFEPTNIDTLTFESDNFDVTFDYPDINNEWTVVDQDESILVTNTIDAAAQYILSLASGEVTTPDPGNMWMSILVLPDLTGITGAELQELVEQSFTETNVEVTRAVEAVLIDGSIERDLLYVDVPDNDQRVLLVQLDRGDGFALFVITMRLDEADDLMPDIMVLAASMNPR